MENTIEAGSVLQWFSGKSRANMVEALSLVNQSCIQNFWVPKASRRVRACMTKANIAYNLGKRFRRELEALKDTSTYGQPRKFSGWDVSFLLTFGSVPYSNVAPDFKGVQDRARNAGGEVLARVVEQAEKFYNDFAELRRIVIELDRKRPVPQFTFLGVSPTVTALLKSLGLVVNISTLRVPEREVRWVKREVNGVMMEEPVCFLIFPKGTVFGASRYAEGTKHNDQCQACGHAIKNGYNWVPVIIDNEQGVPYALYIGRDCARNLFGIKVDGVFEIATEQRGPF